MRCRRFAAWLVLGLLFSPMGSYAQGRTANWIFGDGYHVKFTEGEPEVLPFVGGFNAFEGASCISDTTGSLLFYSNTIRAWNANFQPLWNSDTLPAASASPGTSKTNGSLFLPWPGDTTDRYFAFFQMNDLDNRLYCSKIDRSLDGGLGGVMDEFKNVQVFNYPVCEQLLAVKQANGRDWWIITRKGPPPSNLFAQVLFTPFGFIGDTLQPTGFSGGMYGEMATSANGALIAIASMNETCFPTIPVIGLYDFDRCSGSIAIRDTLATRACHYDAYGLAFSSSGNKLYYTTGDKIRLYQIDATQEVLRDSLILSFSGPSVFLFKAGQLERVSTGEIAMVYSRILSSEGIEGLTNHMALIRHPELEGIACNFDTFALDLNGRENTTFSLPNFANYDLGPLVGSPCDTLSPQDTTLIGLHHQPLQNISWSVNPSISSGSFTVTGGPVSWLVVHDLYGREVLRQWHEERSTFELTEYPAGVYLVSLRGVDGTTTLPRKIVRQ